MIGALRRKFIRISVASTLLVFTVILLLLSLLTRAQMDRTVDRLTDAIASNDGVFPEFDASAQEPPAQFPYLAQRGGTGGSDQHGRRVHH